jgi:hypothetical protein
MMSLFSRLFRKAPPSPAPAPQADRGPVSNDALSRTPEPKPDRSQATAAEEQALQAAIDARDGAAIARLVTNGTSTKVRQRAAHAVEDPDVLRQLIRDVRGGNDKSVYKILTAKRDVFLDHARKEEQLHAEIGGVLAALERHSQRSYDPLYAPTLDQLESRWKAVAVNARAEAIESAQGAIDRGREVIASHLRQVAAEASRELAAANAAAEAQRLQESEQIAASTAAAEQAQIVEASRRAQTEKQEAEQLASRQVGGLIRKARGALNDGSTGRAAGLRRAIEEKLAGAPPLPGYLASQLAQLDTKLNELKDWKSFSVAPKRLELMEEMESLVDATLDPPVLAEKIKDLQEQWRTLSKGAGENLEADWQRFQQAAQQAYQPCREYFEAQSLVRQENLRRREALLSRLTAFEAGHDWEQPDWRTVITALRESKQQWRQHSPVERAANKAVQEQFEAVSAKLQDRLDGEYARNLKEKERLIERARQLLDSEDNRQAIESVKQLQQDWRGVGPVPREADHRLWEEFRQHIDAIFQKRQQEFASYTAGLEANKAQAVGLCEQLEKLAATSGAELLSGAQALSELRQSFEALGEFPRADARALRARFERALDLCEEALAQQHARDAERSWNDLFEAANHVRAYRLARAGGAETTRLDTLRLAAESHTGSIERWPKGGLDAVKQALARETCADQTANEAALKMLCIRAEILTDVTTPSEDQSLRREYQVQRLMQSMGQGIRADETELDRMAIEWVGVGPVEESVYLRLLERFRRCRERSRSLS